MQDHHWKLTIRFSVVKDSILTRDSSGNLQKHKCHFRVEVKEHCLAKKTNEQTKNNNNKIPLEP